MDALTWLQSWYSDHCDGDWEHDQRVHLGTLDNPGWRLKVGLIDTDLEARAYEKLEIYRTEADWVRCWVEGQIFHGACGKMNLIEMLAVFRAWAELGEIKSE